MSTETSLNPTEETFDDHTPSEAVTYRFKTTEENRSVNTLVYVNDKVRNFVRETSIRSAKWRSMSQFVNDALLFYLDGGNDDRSVERVLELANRTSDNHLSVSITPTLFFEIEMLVNHSHTPWNYKQDFYTCALFSYIEAGMPSMKGMRR
jgi:hypothetical protein